MSLKELNDWETVAKSLNQVSVVKNEAQNPVCEYAFTSEKSMMIESSMEGYEVVFSESFDFELSERSNWNELVGNLALWTFQTKF